MARKAPDYSWVNRNLEERGNEDFIKQYGAYCRENGIPFDGESYLQASRFAYEPPPTNMGLAAFSA
jgi:hypothetical protein